MAASINWAGFVKPILKEAPKKRLELSALRKQAVAAALSSEAAGGLDKKALRKQFSAEIATLDIVSVSGEGDEAIVRLLKKDKKGAAEAAEAAVAAAVTPEPEKKTKKKRSAGDDAVPTGLAASAVDVAKFREEKCITMSDESVLPLLEFSQAGYTPSLLHSATSKFERPTPIQAQVWPVLLAKRDLIGIAETGSGKTLAFVLPAMEHILRRRTGGAPPCKKAKGGSSGGHSGSEPLRVRALVLAPTRELANQSADVAEACGHNAAVNIRTASLVGGLPKGPQKAALAAGAELVVATPGRLKDLVEEGSVDLSAVDYLVLDEADRMLDMGFLPDIRAIIGACLPLEQRTTAMLSATWPDAVRAAAEEFLRPSDGTANAPVRICIGKNALELAANTRITQIVEVIEDRAREPRLLQLLNKYHGKRNNRVLVFALYKKEAARLEANLQRAGWNCSAVHGDKSQPDRTKAVDDFKANTCPLLIATDVAARGLDIPDVEYVINFSFPLTIEDYVHRIGRTARGGKDGTAHTFFHAGDKAHAGELNNILLQAEQKVPEELKAFGLTTKKKEHKLYGNFGPGNVDMSKKGTKITFN